MILLSLVLVVVSAVALGWGIMTTTDELVWSSLVAGLLAVALVVGSVVRLRRRVVESPAPPTPAGPPAGPGLPAAPADLSAAPTPSPSAGAPSAPSGAAPSGAAPSAPDPVPGSSAPAEPAAGTSPPVPTPAPEDVRAPAPATGAWPWPARPADGPSRSGWTGPVGPPGAWPAPPPPARPADQPGSAAGRPAGSPAGPAAESAGVGSAPPADAAPDRVGEVPEALGVSRDRPLGEPFPVADGEPPAEDIPVRDALRVAQLADEVRVVDGHPRYHLAGCAALAGADPLRMPVSAARRAGFTPCGVCGPDRTLLSRVADRRRLD